ncbi:MAG: hypothetical protein ACP5HU_07015 [Phycisphaerae bacterium]
MTKRTARRGVFLTEVASNEPLCRDHYVLRLPVAGFPPTSPGQFVQIQCRRPVEPESFRVVDWSEERPPQLGQPELTGSQPLLRRPFSLAGRRRNGQTDELEIIYRAIGRGTSWMAQVKPGEQLSILGPLGNGFAVSERKSTAVLVGGGVGVPPLLYQAEALTAAGKRTFAFIGAGTSDLLPVATVAEVPGEPEPTGCVKRLADLGVLSVIATDDASLGFGGFVSDAFAQWLDRSDPSADDVVVYSCGPEAMMRTVGDLCISRGIECRLAMERHMACGMGTCQSCIVKIRDDSPKGWSYKLCCTDGPVFDASDIIWD